MNRKHQTLKLKFIYIQYIDKMKHSIWIASHLLDDDRIETLKQAFYSIQNLIIENISLSVYLSYSDGLPEENKELRTKLLEIVPFATILYSEERLKQFDHFKNISSIFKDNNCWIHFLDDDDLYSSKKIIEIDKFSSTNEYDTIICKMREFKGIREIKINKRDQVSDFGCYSCHISVIRTFLQNLLVTWRSDLEFQAFADKTRCLILPNILYFHRTGLYHN
jgi:hypothetical protein